MTSTDKSETSSHSVRSSPGSSTQLPSFQSSGASCPLEEHTLRPLALAGRSVSPQAVQQWYMSHRYCTMCNVHHTSPCEMPYYVYNAHRDAVAELLLGDQRGSHSTWRLPLASQLTIRTWMDNFLSTAIAECHKEHLPQMFSDAAFHRADHQKASYLRQQQSPERAIRHEGLTNTGAAPMASSTRVDTDWETMGNELRRQHQHLLKDAGTLEALQQMARWLRTQTPPSSERSLASDQHARAVETALAAAQGADTPAPPTECAMLVDIAVNLRDMIECRRRAPGASAASQQSLLMPLYRRACEPSIACATDNVPEPKRALRGSPACKCGVWVGSDGELHVPAPHFSCPASSQELLRDINDSLQALLAKEGELNTAR